MKESSKIVGIQGGHGSFNEEAALANLANYGIANYQLEFLHTTENVFKSLEKSEIDFGQFAIRNTLGGEVEESVLAMSGRKFFIIGEYHLKVAHALMINPQAKLADIEIIITHPQVLLQCKQTLQARFGGIKLNECEGDLIDPAKVAELIGANKLPKNIATLSNKLLAKIYNLQVVAENLQDSDDNYTTFLLVKP